MQNGPRTFMSARQSRPAASFAARSKRGTSNAARPQQNNSQNAQRNYERYVALARAEALIGNTVGAENYYQYAEHYYRSMYSNPDAT
jgi:hypothetical protein